MSKEAVMLTDLPGLLHRGKVRDTYRVSPGVLMMVATDRISAFDVVMDDPIPQKGVLLVQMSAHWFVNVIADLVPNHMIALADDETRMALVPNEGALAHLPDAWRNRTMLIKEAERIDMECVVRGYLAGSAWAEYSSVGTVNGARMPEGLVEAERLSEPIFTPSTKAEDGHDQPLSQEDAVSLVGRELHEQLRETSIQIYERAWRYSASRGMILVDTKFEFGFVDGELTLIDEVLTPDSSRFWEVDDWRPGQFPPAYDKQHLREWLLQSGWNLEPPPPKVPREVSEMTYARYLSAYERLTGDDSGPDSSRI